MVEYSLIRVDGEWVQRGLIQFNNGVREIYLTS